MASKRKNKYSTCAVYKNEKSFEQGKKPVFYLSWRDEEKGYDIELDLRGYCVVAL